MCPVDTTLRMVGRPSEYTQEIATRICAELAQGKSLRTVCRADDMPCVATVFNWIHAYPAFLEQYTRAKEESADALSDEMLEIADDGTNDWMERLGEEDKPVGYVINGEHVQRSRLRIETRKWLASKLKPKRYGDKVDLAHTGGDGGPLVVQVLQFADHSNPTPLAPKTLPAPAVVVPGTGRQEV